METDSVSVLTGEEFVFRWISPEPRSEDRKIVQSLEFGTTFKFKQEPSYLEERWRTCLVSVFE